MREHPSSDDSTENWSGAYIVKELLVFNIGDCQVPSSKICEFFQVRVFECSETMHDLDVFVETELMVTELIRVLQTEPFYRVVSVGERCPRRCGLDSPSPVLAAAVSPTVPSSPWP
jgi:hypothetical protein